MSQKVMSRLVGSKPLKVDNSKIILLSCLFYYYYYWHLGAGCSNPDLIDDQTSPASYRNNFGRTVKIWTKCCLSHSPTCNSQSSIKFFNFFLHITPGEVTEDLVKALSLGLNSNNNNKSDFKNNSSSSGGGGVLRITREERWKKWTDFLLL